ncbi:antibiotic biosynthesis monooxygenase [Sinomonas terrae]|uniref:Antibiotic biosynthesis monooxygenase n=1 Tax=Sinomonas terrae TaxID=2908838 RepID=A0ABS9TZJ9_9MICC|nr:antibiotic biosynthesis monooxygenase [Sinomonas terrae]MCH6469859.1 antibiotic biosynthesis monooxygenase [Sinomonas terrae]
MSVIVAVKVFGDTGAFRKSLEDRADDYRRIAKQGKENGALSHRFALGDGFVLVNDEWESADAFQGFFGTPEMREFIGSDGGDPNRAPEITVGESIDSPDKF